LDAERVTTTEQAARPIYRRLEDARCTVPHPTRGLSPNGAGADGFVEAPDSETPSSSDSLCPLRGFRLGLSPRTPWVLPVRIALLYGLTMLVFYFALSRDRVAVDDRLFIRMVVFALMAPILTKYALHLLLAPWYPAVEALRARGRSDDFLPSVSVLIPAWNEEVGIRQTIMSVLETKYPRLEIIVVNDGSTDRTHEVVTAFIAQHRRLHVADGADTVIRYTVVPKGGKARALNRALSEARGDLVVITIDSDCVMDESAIKNMVKHFADPRVASVAGNVVIGTRATPIGILQQLEYLYGFYFKRADSILNSVYIVGGAAAAYRRQILADLGGFDETIITEDIEMSTRLQDRGYHIRYAADAVVYTEGPSDFKGLCRQRLRWKFGRLLTFYRYRHLFFSRRRTHNRYLAFMVFPVALFAEVLLFFEAPLLIAFYAYTFLSNDLAPLLCFIVLLTAIVCVQILSDRNIRYHRNLFVLAPIAWLLFYFMDLVEYQALVRSAWLLITQKDLAWQTWLRVGVRLDAVRERS
jgi:cellulose synthase/poly-beta-1,6-N-acetylglucosamine synthase-like glycosyltransferase